MCHVVAIIGTIFLAKLVMRALFRHRMIYGRCGGFGGGGRWRRWGSLRHHPHHPYRGFDGGAIDLGEYDDEDLHAARRNGGAVDVSAKVDEVMSALDLNARQAAEASDVISIVRGAVGPLRFARNPQIVLALRASGKATFDHDLAAAALDPKVAPEAAKEAIDALEHLHNILTDDQRSTLLKLTARS